MRSPLRAVAPEEEEEEEVEVTSSWNSLCRMIGPVFELVFAVPKSYSEKRAL
jgi:hypothetical protein